MANIGSALAILAGALGGGATSYGEALDVRKARQRQSALDALNAAAQRFGQGAQTAQLQMAARQQGYVPMAPNAVDATEAAGNSGALGFSGPALAAMASAAKARGGLSLPSPDGSTQTLQYSAFADPVVAERAAGRSQMLDTNTLAEGREQAGRDFTAKQAAQLQAFEAGQKALDRAAELQRTKITADAMRDNRAAAGDAQHEVRIGQMRNEYNHLQPIEGADRFASNASMALEGVRLAKAGNPMGHQMAITGFLRTTHPDAVVRTTDKGMLVEGQGIPGEIAAWVQRNTGPGGIVSKAALDYIDHAVRASIPAQQATVTPIQAFYGRQAGADSARVVRDPFAAIAPSGGSLQSLWDQAAQHLRDQGKSDSVILQTLGARP